MPIRILTVPFDPVQEVFHDDAVTSFISNKRVISMRPEFFRQDGRTYWTVFVEYENVLSDHMTKAQAEDGLTGPQKLLMKRLREWRKEKADREKIPVFIIATNKQLEDVVRQAPRTIEALRQISGFGNKKVERHGKEILDILKGFNVPSPPKDNGPPPAPQPPADTTSPQTSPELPPFDPNAQEKT